MDKLAVQHGGPIRCRDPGQKYNLNLIIEWKPGEKEINESPKRCKKSKDNPVHHPLDIFLHVLCLDCLVAGLGRVQLA